MGESGYTIYPEALPASELTSTIKKIRDRLKTAVRDSRRMHVLSGPLVSYTLRYFDRGSLFGNECERGWKRVSGS